ncbi:hypothetical protein DFH11DRAFT_1586640, partial [Phellopilus nigrolimitatus]
MFGWSCSILSLRTTVYLASCSSAGMCLLPNWCFKDNLLDCHNGGRNRRFVHVVVKLLLIDFVVYPVIIRKRLPASFDPKLL